MHRMNPDEFTYKPNGWIAWYINWTFKTNFFAVFMSFLVVFMFLIFLFGFALMTAGMGKGQCFIIGDGDFTDTDARLADGFALSWTTFTTVGYGAVYPATGNEYEKQIDCIWITLITTIESFVGLLYAGMCAAILFGKVGRIQSHAQVCFSDAICIEYGKEDIGSDKKMSGSSSSSRHMFPLGSFESTFRIGTVSNTSTDEDSFYDEHDDSSVKVSTKQR